MARTVIGLDVGTSAVRAAEVRFGRGRPTLVRFAQVALEPGSVVAGEVVDATSVGAAIRRLWRDGGFRGKRVVTGVAGQRVVARTTELPAMSDDDLRSSLPFQVQELIPIPLDEAVIDHQVLESLPGDGGEVGDRLRLLVVAVHRDVVRSLLAALEAGGLAAARVDLIPFALIRALHDRDFADIAEGGGGAAAEAIVDIGGGVTNVVVHEHGVPRFLRSLPTGGVELTEALVTDLDVDFASAEAMKRAAADGGATDLGGHDDAGEPRDEIDHARAVFRAALVPVLEEIRTSLDFWQAQSEDEQLRRVVVSGGASVPDEVIERLERLMAVPVARARPFAHVELGRGVLDPEQLARAQAIAAVPIGLALSGEALSAGGHRISLLPEEVRVEQRERRQVVLAGGAVAAFAAVLLSLYLLRAGRVSDAKQEAASAEARNAGLRAQVAELQDVEQLEADLAARRTTIEAVLQGDVSWVRLIQEIATVMPDDMWLTSFTGSRGQSGAPGTISVRAMGFDHVSAAHWLIRLADVPALTGVWVPSSTLTESEGQDLVTFSSDAQLTTAAASSRVDHYTGADE